MADLVYFWGINNPILNINKNEISFEMKIIKIKLRNIYINYKLKLFKIYSKFSNNNYFKLILNLYNYILYFD